MAIASAVLRWGLRIGGLFVLLLILLASREFAGKLGLNPSAAGIVGFVRGVVLFAAAVWLFQVTKARSPSTDSREPPLSSSSSTQTAHPGERPQQDARNWRPLPPGYSDRVLELKRRMSGGELSCVDASSRVVSGAGRTSPVSPIMAAGAAQLEATQTWWPDGVDQKRFVLTFVYVRNVTSHSLRKVLFELWDVPATEVSWNKILYELTPFKPLSLGQEAVLRFEIRVPEDHPMRRGPVNAVIVSVE